MITTTVTTTDDDDIESNDNNDNGSDNDNEDNVSDDCNNRNGHWDNDYNTKHFILHSICGVVYVHEYFCLESLGNDFWSLHSDSHLTI